MKLSPREVDKLVLHGAGVLAQKRLARGLRLNQPEAVALIATQVNFFRSKSAFSFSRLGLACARVSPWVANVINCKFFPLDGLTIPGVSLKFFPDVDFLS